MGPHASLEQRARGVGVDVREDGDSQRSESDRRLEAELAERRRAESLLDGERRVLEMVASSAPLSASLNALVALIEEHAPGMLGSILLLDRDGVHLRHGAAPHLPPAYTSAIDGAAIGPCAGSCGTAAYRAEPVIVEDIATDPLWTDYRALALPHGLHACWSTPIRDERGGVLGTFAMYYEKPALPNAEHLRLIEIATHVAAIAIARDRTEAALRESVERARRAEVGLRRSNRELRAISRCNQTLMHADDEPSLLHDVCRIVRDEAGHRFAWVAFADEAKRLRVVASAGHDDARVTDAELASEDAPSASALRDGRTRCVQDLAREPSGVTFRDRAIARGTRSMLALPLKDALARTFGVLCIESAEADAFTREELRLLEELAADLAFGITFLRGRIELARAERERATHLWFLESMDRIHRAMQGRSEIEPMVSDVLDVVLSIFGCDRAWIVTPPNGDGPWRASMERTRPEYPGSLALGADIPVDEDVRRTFASLHGGAPMAFGSDTDPPIAKSIVERFAIRSMIAMRLGTNDHDLHLFGLHQCSHPRVWTTEEKALFQEIGRRISDALTTLLAHRRLQESEARYRRIVDTATEGIWALGPDGRTTLVNARMATMLGYAIDEMLGRPLTDFVFEQDVPDQRRRLEDRRLGKNEESERRFRRKDGAVVWVHASATPIADVEGRFQGSFAMVTDVTERKRVERNAALMGFALNNVHEAAFLLDVEGRLLYVNEEACRSLGYARSELLAMRVGDVDVDFPSDRWGEHWNELKAKGSLVFESRHRAKDGRVFPVEIGANYFVYDGQAYNLALARDVTERKRAESERERLLEDVQEERSRLGAVLDTAPVGIGLYLAPDGRVALVNKAAEAILGRPDGGAGMSSPERGAYHDLRAPGGEPVPPEELPLARSLRGETLTGVELLARHAAGHDVQILENSAPIHDSEGRIVGAVLAFQDITPIREQERLRDAFIATAAHELKTPVTTMKGYAELLRRWTPAQRALHEEHALDVIHAQAQRINARVHEMLDVVRFRKGHAPARVGFDLGELADQVVARTQAVVGTRRLRIRREARVPVEGDRERLEEVLLALVNNAVQFSPEGSEIEVRIRHAHGCAIASVRDQGIGIPASRQAHVFEPFYEAIPSGAPGYRGVVPLSLYLAKLTIERHGGRIWLESEEGKGATFFFSLPLAEAT